ncbi:MAG TPA: S9 family peptidase [Flavobacteriaceae bacterium]|nr:S9 family peptidase [Flavobacteriaceae bacterium]
MTKSKQQSSTKQITLEDIWKYGTFRTERLGGFHSAKNGDYYYVINNRGAQLDKYSYKTLEKVGTLVDAANLNGINSLFNYTFNKEENKLIIGTETEQIYRHSSRGIFYVYDLSSKKLEKISDNLIQEPTFSPDGNKVAFMYQNNLFYKDLNTNTTKQFTFDGEKNKILNGITDWVYEEEFAFVRAFQWNNNSNKIAFIRFDETKVPEFSMDIYGDDLYPKQQVFKYPKAGENNAEVSLFMYDLTSNSNKKIDLGKDQQHYIPRIEWTKNNKLCVTTLNRHQNNLNLIFVDQNTLQYKIVLNEKDEAYVAVTDNLTFLSDNSFIWTSEKDGYNHIYHYSENGKLINQVTKGNWEVTNYYGFDNKTNKIYFQSTQDGSINRTVSVIDLDGTNLQKLSVNIGSNSAAFSNSFNYYINTFSNSETPTIYTLNESKTGKKIKIIKENSTVLEKLVTYNLGKKEFSTITTKDGNFNMWMMKPANFDASKKYPLFMYQYSGPGSQSVANRWKYSDDYWYHMLNQKGYIVVCVDGRGTGYKGRDFKKVTYKELGKYEIEDQINAAKELGNLDYIDQNRIGIWGWSYGGYMSSLGITKGADTFKMAIAVAPVTSWRFYDSIYTERYMQTPQENASGYDDNSPINFAKLLKGKYLLIHGTGDDNVHVQNTMRMANALVKENKPFEMFIYPDRAHGIYSTRNDRLHLYNKMTKFIEDNL